MSLALRYGACGSFFLASILLAAGLFLPVERVDPHSGDRVYASAWSVDGGFHGPNGNVSKGGTWYDGAFSGHDGIWLLRFAGPLLLIGLFTLFCCGFMILSGNGVKTGWVGTSALLVAGLGLLFLLFGVNQFAKSITTINEVVDSDISPHYGFWSLFVGLLLGCGAALTSFSVKPEVTGRVGPDGEPLPPLPVLSVENPEAFNPMANRDPRLFKAEEQQYKSFEVTGGRKTFKAKAETMEEPSEETTWEDVEAKAPGAPPASKPGGASAQSSKAPAKPATTPATKGAAEKPKA